MCIEIIFVKGKKYFPKCPKMTLSRDIINPKSIREVQIWLEMTLLKVFNVKGN